MGKGKKAGWGTVLFAILFVIKGVHRGYKNLERSEAAQAPAPQVDRTGPGPGPVAMPDASSPDKVFAAASPAVALIELLDASSKPISQGSGFFVSADGLLVTNFHVIEGGATAKVHCTDGTVLNVRGAVSVAPAADLALLDVDTRGKAMSYLALAASDLPAVGSRVFAIGNPRGMTNTLSDGLVSATRQLDGFEGTLIQTSAPISPGSSGGPLLATDGTVVGVTSAGIDDAQNLNFAVPADRVRKLLLAKGANRALSSVSPPRKPPALKAGMGSPGTPPGRPVLDMHDEVAYLIEAGNYSQAMMLLREIQPTNQNSPRYWCLLGKVQESGFGNFDVAEDAYRRAVKLKPSYEHAHERLGLMLAHRGRGTEAIECFRTLAKLNPKSPAGHRGAGIACQQLGDHNQAVAYFDWAIKLNAPKSGDIHLLRGDSLCHLGRDDEAMSAFTTGLRALPKSTLGLNGIGDIHFRAGRMADAKRSYGDVLRLYPKNGHAHLQLGRIAQKEGNLASARLSWEKAMAGDPRGPDGRAALQLLLSTRGGRALVRAQ
jgi:S1-C subfamily serine protease/tetratricopeptide (TPR) repeat protein